MVSINKLRGELIMNKKGAVELSMTTIIIIVIGITVLSLGLVWIRGVFTDVGGITKSAFEQGQGEIDEIFSGSTEPIALSPSTLTLDQGKSETVTLNINNLGKTTTPNVQASVEAKASGGTAIDTLKCSFTDLFGSSSDTYSLNSGFGVKLGILVEDSNSPLGTYVCRVKVDGLEGGQQSISLVINVA